MCKPADHSAEEEGRTEEGRTCTAAIEGYFYLFSSCCSRCYGEMVDEGEVLDVNGADLITSRLAQWGIAEDEEEEDTIVVDEDKVLSLGK
ncbi:MAG: hypothetical protein HC767_02810 [Akkermansiaceae bacterium]|nr:hypothetical protein [Akkermansiaceae bacterium]